MRIMRTTIDIPEDVLRRAKATAAIRGVKLKDLIAQLLDSGLPKVVQPGREPESGRRNLPVLVPAADRQIPVLTNAELEEIFLREDLDRWGYDRSA